MKDKIKTAGCIAIIVGLIIIFGALIAIAFCLHPLFGILVAGGVLVLEGCMICSI